LTESSEGPWADPVKWAAPRGNTNKLDLLETMALEGALHLSSSRNSLAEQDRITGVYQP